MMAIQVSSETSVSKLLFYVEQYQAVQKANPTSSPQRKSASDALQPLFAALAAKQKGK